MGNRRHGLCVVPQCPEVLGRHQIMCKPHWAKVPHYQQERVADELTPGEPPHKAFYWMVSEAIAAVYRYEIAVRVGATPTGDTW